MNSYKVEPLKGESFVVEAEDSDMAVQCAGIEAKDRFVLSGVARLFLLTESGEINLGEFVLDGYSLPTSWTDVQALVKRVREEAMRDAKENTDFRCHRSRGVLLSVNNNAGVSLVTTGDDVIMPKTLKAFRQEMERLQVDHPDMTEVWLECGVDSAASVRDLNEVLDYEPWTGEASALLWRKGEEGIS